ncbi:MAG: heparinase II/III family protein [candidate division FCPU426 bacterium]
MKKNSSLFLDPKTLASIRRKIRSGQGKRLYARVREGALGWLKRPPVAPPPHPSTQDDRRPAELMRARTSQNCLLHTALMYRISGDRRFLDRAWAELECWLLQWDSWCDPFHGDRRFFDLMTGEVGLSMALAYDWLKEDLSPGQRALLSSQIRSRVLDCYRRHTIAVPKGAQPAWWQHRDMNWNPVCHGGAMIAALALRDEYPQWKGVTEWSKRCMAPYFAKMARFGGSDEGSGYWQYGMRYGLLALEAMRQAGEDPGPWLEHPGTESSSYFPIEFAPGLKPISWGDAADVIRSSVMYLLASRFKNADFMEYGDLACIGPKTFPGKDGLENWIDLPLALIFRPEKPFKPSTSPCHPARSSACVFDRIGWSCTFDDWKRPTLVAGFKCGDLGANHTQLDNNSFQIIVQGEALAEDLGTGVYNQAYFSEARWSMYKVATEGHNSLLINGKGQLPHTLGTLKAIRGVKGCEGLLGDATRCYGRGPLRIQRQFLVLDHAWIVVLDDVILPEPGTIEWRCHTFKAATAAGSGAMIQGKKNSLSLLTAGAKFRLRHKWVPMSIPGPASVTDKPLPTREGLLTLTQSGLRRFLLPVLISPDKARVPAELSLTATEDGYALLLRFKKGKERRLVWKEEKTGLRLKSLT